MKNNRITLIFKVKQIKNNIKKLSINNSIKSETKSDKVK